MKEIYICSKLTISDSDYNLLLKANDSLLKSLQELGFKGSGPDIFQDFLNIKAKTAFKNYLDELKTQEDSAHEN